MKFDLEFSCSKKWQEMDGSEQKRHCGHCDKFVHNFSILDRDEIEEILYQEGSCARFTINEKGEVRTRRGFVGGLVLASILTGCGAEQHSEAVKEPVEIQNSETIEKDPPKDTDIKEIPQATIDNIAEGFVGQVAISPEQVTEKKEEIINTEEIIMMGGPKVHSAKNEKKPAFIGRVKPKSQKPKSE